MCQTRKKHHWRFTTATSRTYVLVDALVVEWSTASLSPTTHSTTWRTPRTCRPDQWSHSQAWHVRPAGWAIGDDDFSNIDDNVIWDDWWHHRSRDVTHHTQTQLVWDDFNTFLWWLSGVRDVYQIAVDFKPDIAKLGYTCIVRFVSQSRYVSLRKPCTTC